DPRNATECTELLSKLAHHVRMHSAKNRTRNGVSATAGDSLQFRKILFLAEMGLYVRATQLAVTLVHALLEKTNGSQANPHHLATALDKLALTIASTSMPQACSVTHNFPPLLPTSKTCGRVRAVRAEVACRIDLAGGWTDTPPITYQCQDPAVLNVAVLVDGKKPISCECIKLDAYSGVYMDVCGKLLHFETAKDVWDNRCHPNKDGSLLCAILVASGIVTNDRMDGIEAPKFRFHEGDTLDLSCRMGTSSILSAALLASLWRLFGKEYTNGDLISTVLKVEQLHTTGGGWQDQ
ncbi:L-fucose kinase-like protein, partial [Aphelenchoides avenae]